MVEGDNSTSLFSVPYFFSYDWIFMFLFEFFSLTIYLLGLLCECKCNGHSTKYGLVILMTNHVCHLKRVT